MQTEQHGFGDRISRGTPAPSGTLLLEVAWEVCNQVGGIYQVLRSKAPFMVERWGEQYCLVGPYVADKAALDFEPAIPEGWLAEVIAALASEGIVARYGHWLRSGRPQVILLEHGMPKARLDAIKLELWESEQIEAPDNFPLVDNAITFAHATTRTLAHIAKYWTGKATYKRVIAHFHEWQAGVAVPMIRTQKLPVATVFTTHATILGRYIASSSDDLYVRLPTLDHMAEATHFGIRAQHIIERKSAEAATVFTTVSPITGEECTYLLGRKPDIITPNGLNVERYDVGHELQTLHAQYTKGIRRFVMGHFFPSYSFNLDRTLYFFTSGRFEPHNKGFDLCLEAMARLNAELKAADLGVTVVFFIVTQRDVVSMNPHVLRDRGVLEELRAVSKKIADGLAEQLFLAGAAGKHTPLEELADEYWMLRYRRTQYALRSDRLPETVTHVIPQPETDPVLTHINALGLVNRKEDPVKVIYHPQFINSVNPLWRMEYEQFVRGCHLGIFPSSYEPWGYTPLECVCMGVPAITSDLSGFGRYLDEVFPDHDRHGMTVLGRRDQDFHSTATELSKRLLAFCRLRQRQRIALRNSVENHSHSFDWSQLGTAYHETHDLALQRHFKS